MRQQESILKNMVILCLVVLLLALFLWTAFQGYAPQFGGGAMNYYSLLTRGFLSGHLYLPVKPSPKLLALADPYNPLQNAPFRLHDASLYHGHWYLYFGVTPVLVFWLPLHLLGIEANYSMATALFLWMGICVQLLIIGTLTRQMGLRVKTWQWVVLITMLGLNGSSLYFLRRTAIYEVAISMGYLCVSLGVFFLAYYRTFPKVNYLLFGGLFLGLAVGARPDDIFFVPVMVFASIYLIKINNYQLDKKIRNMIFLWVPYISVGIILALYNQMRFGSIFELGTHYQLAGLNMHEVTTAHLSNIFPNLYFYLWCPVVENKIFPFFYAFPRYPWAYPQTYLYPEPVAGIFSLAPELFLLCLVPGFFKINTLSTNRHMHESLQNLGAVAASSVLVLVLVCYILPSATMRYLWDFMPWFMLICGILWIAIGQMELPGLSKSKVKLIQAIFIFLVIYSSVLNMGIGMTGYYNLFERVNPVEYIKIAHWFE